MSIGYSKAHQLRGSKIKVATRPRANKYNAQRQTVDGYSFDSKMEATYYGTLSMRKRLGEIKEIIKQKSIELYCNGKPIIKWKVDFAVILANGDVELHEVKGVETGDYRIKKKLTEAQLEDIGKRQFDGKTPKLLIIKKV